MSNTLFLLEAKDSLEKLLFEDNSGSVSLLVGLVKDSSDCDDESKSLQQQQTGIQCLSVGQHSQWMIIRRDFSTVVMGLRKGQVGVHEG